MAAGLWLACIAASTGALPLETALRSLVLAPALEETLFRAGLQHRLSQRLSAQQANTLTALFFALTHWLLTPSWLAALTFLVAWCIGHVFQATQERLLPCIALHALANWIWLASPASAWLQHIPLR